MKSRIVEIVDIVSLKFASDEAAGWKLTSWNRYFIVNNFLKLIVRVSFWSNVRLLTRVYGIYAKFTLHY